jgi:hypothetical protein
VKQEKKKKMLDINELLDDIRKIRNDLVAQSSPHFQSLTNIIYKWEMKLLEENPENKIHRFDNTEEDAS